MKVFPENRLNNMNNETELIIAVRNASVPLKISKTSSQKKMVRQLTSLILSSGKSYFSIFDIHELMKCERPVISKYNCNTKINLGENFEKIS